MGRYCCVVGCSNTDRTGVRKLAKKNISFHSFPKERKELWTKIINRRNDDGSLWQPNAWSFICSEHFEGGQPSCHENDISYVPTIFPSTSVNSGQLSSHENFNSYVSATIFPPASIKRKRGTRLSTNNKSRNFDNDNIVKLDDNKMDCFPTRLDSVESENSYSNDIVDFNTFEPIATHTSTLSHSPQAVSGKCYGFTDKETNFSDQCYNQYSNHVINKYKDVDIKPFKRRFSIEGEDFNFVNNNLNKPPENKKRKLSTESLNTSSQVDDGEFDISNVSNVPKLIHSTRIKIPLIRYGWRREIFCTYLILESGEKKFEDMKIYYHTPDGFKLSSIYEINDYLLKYKSNLKLQNFSFARNKVGLGSDYEFVTEDIKYFNQLTDEKESVETIEMQTQNQNQAIKKKNVNRKKNLDEIELVEQTGMQTQNVNQMNVRKSLEKKKKLKRKLNMPNVNRNNDVGNASPVWSSSITSNQSNALVCSIMCPLALGCIPTLQCTSCLCLYHPQCLGLNPFEEYYNYKCTNCRTKIHFNQEQEEQQMTQRIQTPKKTMGNQSEIRNRLDVPQDNNRLTVNSKIPQPSPPPLIFTTTPKIVSIRSQASGLSIPSQKIPSRPLLPKPVPSLIPKPSTPLTTVTTPPKQDELMQTLIQYGKAKFIAVPRKTLGKPTNASTIPSSPTASSTKPPSAPSLSINLASSNDNQMRAPGNVTSKSPVGGAYIMTNNPANMGVLLSVPTPVGTPGSHYYVFNNGQMQSILSTPSSIVDQASNRRSPATASNVSSVMMSKSSSFSKSEFALKKDFFSDASLSFNILIKVFSYLRLDDLTRSARVNRLFHAASRHYSLWKTVRLKNCRVNDWESFATCLNKNDCKILSCNKMILKTDPEDIKTMWRSFKNVVGRVSGLQELDLGRCSGPEYSIAQQCPSLVRFSCTFSKKSVLDFNDFVNLRNLTHLFIRGLELRRDVGVRIQNTHILAGMQCLTHLSLTSVKQPDMDWGNFIQSMQQLEWLELGECTKFTKDFVAKGLRPLVNLKRLRLEMVPESIACDILNVIATFPKLDTLELINFDVKQGFEESFPKCVNIRHILIIPTYVRQSAFTVHTMISTLCSMQNTLERLVWGFTLELLKVTEMLISQYGLEFETNTNDYIPVIPKTFPQILKSLNEINSEGDMNESTNPNKSVEVDVLAISKLELMLKRKMSNVNVKLIKIPYTSTVKQFL